MEAIIQEDSPLAAYLEGRGEATELTPSEPSSTVSPLPSSAPSSPATTSFAPSGLPSISSRLKTRLPPPLHISVPHTRHAVIEKIRSALRPRLRTSENERFLEQFGYIIVASQLLGEQTPLAYGGFGGILGRSGVEGEKDGDSPAGADQSTIGLSGALLTATASFLVAWLLHWARTGLSRKGACVAVLLVAALLLSGYVAARHQWLRYVRGQSIRFTGLLVGNARVFDSAAAAAVGFIQEVELVSRGYRISTPLPPISRLEDASQNRRCNRLRKVLSEAMTETLNRHATAFHALQPLAKSSNLDKYYDIYEISNIEVQEFQLGLGLADGEDAETLRALRTVFARIFTARKIVLCTLLALEANGSSADFTRWSTAMDEVQALAMSTGEAAQRIIDLLNEEDHKAPATPSPKVPSTPGRENTKVQLRKLNTLAQGIRALHAKMHLIREEAEADLDNANSSSTEISTTLLTQYESIGADLKNLMQEWEVGRASLAMSAERNSVSVANGNMLGDYISRSSSSFRSSVGARTPMSPTFRIGSESAVAVAGSPLDALRSLNGDLPLFSPLEESSNETAAGGGDGEIFEAVALPVRKKRMSLTRDERMAKMREERERMAAARERMEASTSMLRELETVIKLRPSNRTGNGGARITMLEARLEQAALLKKIVDAIKDLVQDCNFDCNDSGIALQAMDNSHVALVSMLLTAEGFSPFRCDRNIALGINLNSLTKVLRAAQNEDILTLKAEDAPDVVNLVFESSETDRISEYDIKLMDIDQEHLGIPDTEYAATVTMPAAEFQRICRDLSAMSESVSIEASKDGVKFTCNGDIGSGSVTIRQHTNVDKPDLDVSIDLTEPVALTFSLKYLVNFCKASGLSSKVRLCLSQEVPLLVEYGLAGSGHLRFYLAPKIGDDE